MLYRSPSCHERRLLLGAAVDEVESDDDMLAGDLRNAKGKNNTDGLRQKAYRYIGFALGARTS